MVSQKLGRIYTQYLMFLSRIATSLSSSFSSPNSYLLILQARKTRFSIGVLATSHSLPSDWKVLINRKYTLLFLAFSFKSPPESASFCSHISPCIYSWWESRWGVASPLPIEFMLSVEGQSIRSLLGHDRNNTLLPFSY